ncbi:serine/threonine-protein kinase [Actinomadura xylanilytica]|uniref:serine/threonine-protein kinase n=1 Tax=Actinomadura xylanilytica TaxID=887459 RepID=UPI00255A8179|nr:serine/threonine-protein kinase [Actinomadura xylanilytica]MDL4771667.1 serine/threonine-protein kinase [Actinomadura xylanilytica]
MTPVRPLLPDDPARLGRYELVGRLGEGGQSVVYLGRTGDGRQAAVKLLRAQLSRNPEWRGRFEREMKLIGRVAGFCTAQVLDADVSGELPYVVSEYVPGPSLSGLLAASGPRAGTDLDRLAIGTITALAAIHRAGILHRDFKPSNVLMGPDGPRVIDFGIARVLGPSAAKASGVVGTPSYMAPEQVTDAELGAAVDLFAWGSTMLFAATGRHPFGNDTISAVFHRILQQDPDLSPLPGSLRGIVGACLAKDPAARPDAQRVLLDLLGLQAPLAHEAEERPEGALSTGASFAGDVRIPPPTHQVERGGAGRGPAEPRPDARTVPPPSRRRRGRLALAVAVPVLLVAGGGTAWGLMSDRGSEGPAPRVPDTAVPPAAAQAVTAPAAGAISAVLSFDYKTVDQNVAAAHRRVTSRYKTEYDRQLQADNWRNRLQETRSSIGTEVVDSGVVASAADRVTVLSYVKRTVKSANAPTKLLQYPMRVTMVRQDGGWLLDTLYILAANSVRGDIGASSWPAAQGKAVLAAVAADKAVAEGTPVEVGLRAGGNAQQVTALAVVGSCARGACKESDKMTFQRLLLQKSNAGWQIAKSERLSSEGAAGG